MKKAAEFVECLDSMNVKGMSYSCLDYTREWIDKVNRGGLFYVHNNAYNIFISIEINQNTIDQFCIRLGMQMLFLKTNIEVSV